MIKSNTVFSFLLATLVIFSVLSCRKHVDDPEVLRDMETKTYELNGQSVEIHSALPEDEIQALIQDPEIKNFITK